MRGPLKQFVQPFAMEGSIAVVEGTIQSGLIATDLHVLSGNLPEGISIQGNSLDVISPVAGENEEKKMILIPVEVEWEAKDDWNNVDDHRDPWTNEVVGKRIFPDALEPNGEMRRELKVKVKIGGFANQTVHLKVFDVDDPSAIPDPDRKLDENDTDTKKAGDDNIRVAGLLADWGHFLPQQTKK